MKTLIALNILAVVSLVGCASGNYDYCDSPEISCEFRKMPTAQGAATRATVRQDGRVFFNSDVKSLKEYRSRGN